MNYNTLAKKESVDKTVESLTAHNFKPSILQSGKDALAFIKATIPKGASVMNGASVTLEEIGYVAYLKEGAHEWNNAHATILAEKDEAKQAELRKYSVVSDYYVGSVHGVTEDGQLVISSNSGSQMPHLAYTSPNLILIVGTQKIVPTLGDAFDRLDTHVIPLEDARMKKRYGYGTARNKTVVLHAENPGMKRAVHVVFVNEKLGY